MLVSFTGDAVGRLWIEQSRGLGKRLIRVALTSIGWLSRAASSRTPA
jgi:hypothetical protein